MLGLFHVLRSSSALFVAVLPLVHHIERHVPPYSQQNLHPGQTHGYCGIEFERRGDHIWDILRCWDKSQIRRVRVATLSRSSSSFNQEMSILGRTIDAIGPNVRLVSFLVVHMRSLKHMRFIKALDIITS